MNSVGAINAPILPATPAAVPLSSPFPNSRLSLISIEVKLRPRSKWRAELGGYYHFTLFVDTSLRGDAVVSKKFHAGRGSSEIPGNVPGVCDSS